MKALVDFELCESHGVCEFEAPGVFRLNDDDTLQILIADELPAELVDVVARAARACPRQAIRLSPDGPPR